MSRGPVAGQPIISESAFDLRGNVATQTAPYYSGAAPVVTSFQ